MARRRGERQEAINLDAGPDLDPVWTGHIQKLLTEWYAQSARKLPWRVDRNPYRILVSETMLVQTTVAAVIPYFERFMQRFPDFESLAAADFDEVLKAWEGLGYYQRARRLQEAARVIVENHHGVMPETLEQIGELPGVGRYIAGAIRSFAMDLPAPILEANTQRVAARWIGWRDELKARETQDRLWRVAERVVPEQSPGDFNQAFMELGATICIPREPLCLVCPVNTLCQARAEGSQNILPIIAPKAPPKDVREACGVISNQQGEILMVRRGPGRLWEQFWEFPTVHLDGVDPAGRAPVSKIALPGGIELLTGIQAKVGPAVRTIRYAVTTHRVTLEAHLGQSLGGTSRPGPGMIEVAWLSPSDVSNKTLASPTRRLVKHLADAVGEERDSRNEGIGQP